jgi:hypothetical protein
MYVIRETYTSAGGLLDLDGVIRTVVSVSSLTWFIRYQIIIYEDYIFSPSCIGDFSCSSTTKTGRHDIAEILLKVALKHQKSNKKTWGLNFFLCAYIIQTYV